MVYFKAYTFNSSEPVSESERTFASELRNYVVEQAFKLEYGKNFSEFELTFNKYGKPSVGNGIHFNISHTRGFVCCAVSDVPVGIDAEYIRKTDPALINKVCSASEKEAILSSDDVCSEFFKYWTLKESYIKMLGVGLSFPLNKINFDLSGEKPISNAVDAAFDITFIDGVPLALCRKNKLCKIETVRL